MAPTPKLTKEQEDADFKSMGWEVGKELGSGHFAKVKLATRVSDKQQAACKIIEKPKTQKKKDLVANEHKVLTSIDHPYCVKCFDAFETDDRLYLFMELMEGGELFDRIVDMGHFTEQMAQEAVYKLLDALHHMHQKGIAHRDLKPENMLMTSKQPDAICKITDFGLSKFFDEQSSLMKTPCGTPGSIAPEVLHMRGYDFKCDIWSFGVIVYILLCGFPPFYADNDAQLFEKIKKGQYEFLKPYWDPISDEAKNFVRRMLTTDPSKRASAEDLMKDVWLKAEHEKAEDEKLAARTRGMTISDKDTGKALSTAEQYPKHKDKLLKLKGAFLAVWVGQALGSARGDSKGD
jgi:calcium/calmodulin-dependent protein kinase I